MKKTSLLCFALIFAGPLAGAALAEASGPFVQISAGPSIYNTNSQRITENRLQVTSIDQRGFGYALRTGYSWPSGLGAEIGYVDAGYATARGFTLGGAGWSTNLHHTGWTAAATGRFSINERLTVTGRAGLLDYSTKWANSSLVQGILPNKESGWVATGGVNVTWKILDRASLVAGVDYYPGRQKAIAITAGLKATF